MPKFLLLIITFVTLNLFLGLSIMLFFQNISRQHTVKDGITYAALPNNEQVLGAAVVAEDGRIENLKQFFAKYHSILVVYADDIVNAADIYGIDYRLIPAIAMHESGGCSAIPKDSFNCWGFGVYGGKAKQFTNYPEAINTVTQALAKHYVARGLDTPEKIMPVWDPASQGTWAKGVHFFMDQM